MNSLYGSNTRGSEDDSVESKHVALISHYMFNITTAVFDWTSPHFIVQTLQDGTPQVQIHCSSVILLNIGVRFNLTLELKLVDSNRLIRGLEL